MRIRPDPSNDVLLHCCAAANKRTRSTGHNALRSSRPLSSELTMREPHMSPAAAEHCTGSLLGTAASLPAKHAATAQARLMSAPAGWWRLASQAQRVVHHGVRLRHAAQAGTRVGATEDGPGHHTLQHSQVVQQPSLQRVTPLTCAQPWPTLGQCHATRLHTQDLYPGLSCCSITCSSTAVGPA